MTPQPTASLFVKIALLLLSLLALLGGGACSAGLWMLQNPLVASLGLALPSLALYTLWVTIQWMNMPSEGTLTWKKPALWVGISWLAVFAAYGFTFAFFRFAG